MVFTRRLIDDELNLVAHRGTDGFDMQGSGPLG